MQDEILVKGTDGKWYILKGEELLPYEEHGTWSMEHGAQKGELPKGVSAMAHERLEAVGARPARPAVPARPAAAARTVLPTVVSHEEHPLRVELEELIDGVMKNVELRMKNAEFLRDPVLSKRFRAIVSARLREVRDAPETRSMLARPQKVGGMGMSDQGSDNQVAGVVEVIEKAFFEFQRRWKEAEEKRRQEWMSKQRDQRDQRDQREQLAEARELEERYSRLTGGIPNFQSPPVPEQSSVRDFAIPKEIPKPKVQIQKTTVQAAPAPSTASTPSKPLLMPPPPMVAPESPLNLPLTPTPLPQGEGRVRGEEVERVQKPTPYTLTPKPSQKLTDVRRVPKLVGPIEELSSLSLIDFRRIAVSPKEGAEKIAAKIDRLAQESLARKTQGIAAWRRCPLYQEYARIMRRALSEGIAPAEAIGKGAEAASGATLTKDEWYAIMELNQKLRF